MFVSSMVAVLVTTVLTVLRCACTPMVRFIVHQIGSNDASVSGEFSRTCDTTLIHGMVDKCIKDEHKRGAHGEQRAMEHAIGLEELLKSKL